jgi:hypothetical protein
MIPSLFVRFGSTPPTDLNGTILLRDSLQDAFHVLQHLSVPESKDAKPTPLKELGSLRIRGGLLGVLSAIKFDDEFWLKAAEVGDVRTDRFLASKFRTTELTPTQPRPQPPLGISVVRAEIASEWSQARAQDHGALSVSSLVPLLPGEVR